VERFDNLSNRTTMAAAAAGPDIQVVVVVRAVHKTVEVERDLVRRMPVAQTDSDPDMPARDVATVAQVCYRIQAVVEIVEAVVVDQGLVRMQVDFQRTGSADCHQPSMATEYSHSVTPAYRQSPTPARLDRVSGRATAA
jgi:hypothetical protein